MDILKITLFTGMIFHKLLWEILKRKNNLFKTQEGSSIPLQKRIIKIVKIIIFGFLVIQTLFLNLLPISEQPLFIKFVGTIIYFLGLTIAVIGRLQLGKNWFDLEDYRVFQGQSLVSTGIYAYIRHPIYTGDLLFLIGLELALNSWLALCVLLLIPIVIKQALAEENLLLQRMHEYREYRKKTKMFIPYVI